MSPLTTCRRDLLRFSPVCTFSGVMFLCNFLKLWKTSRQSDLSSHVHWECWEYKFIQASWRRGLCSRYRLRRDCREVFGLQTFENSCYVWYHKSEVEVRLAWDSPELGYNVYETNLVQSGNESASQSEEGRDGCGQVVDVEDEGTTAHVNG